MFTKFMWKQGKGLELEVYEGILPLYYIGVERDEEKALAVADPVPALSSTAE